MDIEATENKLLLKKNRLFSNLSDSDLELIASSVKEKKYYSDEFIIRENEVGDEFYIIKSGSVEIIKKGATKNNHDEYYRISILNQGDTIGEIALIESSERTASARVLTETTVLVLSVQTIRDLSSHEKYYSKIIAQLKDLKNQLMETPTYAKMALNLAQELSNRLNKTNLVTVEALRQELHLSKMRVEIGRFLIIIISLLVVYTYCLAFISTAVDYVSSTMILLPMLLFFLGGVIYFMRSTGYPASFFGITLKNWRQSLYEGIVWTIPALLLIVLMKWIGLKVYGYDDPLFEGPKHSVQDLSPLMTVVVIVMYLVMTPLQELLARGVIQGSLQHFLIGKHRILLAIVIANLIYSMTHLHLSTVAAIVVSLYGFLFGWLYSRHHNLIGVSLSHLMVGGWSFFIVGVDKVLIV